MFYVHGSVHQKSKLINVQRDATVCSLYFILLHYHYTCFGCRPHPSSGVHKTVVTASGTCHISAKTVQDPTPTTNSQNPHDQFAIAN